MTSSGSAKASLRASRGKRIRDTDSLLVAAVGDSITEGSPEHDAHRGGDETSQWEYWAELAEPRLSFRNCGVYGERTDEIAARVDDCARGAEVLVVQGGINDLAQGRPPVHAAANLHAMVRLGKELRLRVAIADVLPWNNGWPRTAPQIRELNALIAAIAAEEDLPLLAFHEALEDPERRGRIKQEWAHADGDHPSIAGYRRLGEVAASALRPFLSK
jgi:lysophospholipase L1-like esterase